MGLFGGGNSSSNTNYTTNTADNSQNLSDSKILESGAVEALMGDVNQANEGGVVNHGDYKQLESGAILAESVVQKTDSENLTLNAEAGVTATITQFGDNAAGVVKDALSAVKDITTKNLQLHTDRNLQADQLEAAKGLTVGMVTEFLGKPKVQVTAAAGLLLFLFYQKVK